MVTDKELERLSEKFALRMTKVNEVTLKTIGNRINKIGKMSTSDLLAISKMQMYGEDINKIFAELEKQTGKNVNEIEQMYNAIADKDFKDNKSNFKDIEFVPYKENEKAQNLVKAIAEQTKGEMENISRTQAIGFSKVVDGKVRYVSVTKAYEEAIDTAITSVVTGVSDYQTEMYKVLKPLADSGVRTIDYASGYSRRLDSSVRQMVLNGTRQVNQEMTNEVGEQFGADGYEITAHGDCAEDHLDIQGKQYSKKEYERLNSNLDRPIGTLNCKHFAYPIILGVNLPAYSKSELRELRKESTRKIEYEGKTYTAYEATQVQRKMETKIRQLKESKYLGNDIIDKEANAKIRALTRKYKDFSEKAKLPTKLNRLRVAR